MGEKDGRTRGWYRALEGNPQRGPSGDRGIVGFPRGRAFDSSQPGPPRTYPLMLEPPYPRLPKTEG